ncbi:hypothetical protein B7494_g5611 [Chlorociboria aeruginascens]|nr:hypothetical protein B7494_g5611 [Chlorociboria aeruginascens]
MVTLTTICGLLSLVGATWAAKPISPQTAIERRVRVSISRKHLPIPYKKFKSLNINPPQRNTIAHRSIEKRDVDPATLYPAYNISVPIDHFHNDSKYEPHTDDFYPLRYWFDASNYEEGGPVIVLQSGEDPGTDRLPYLQKGLLQQLAQTTHGIAVVLEHRYYGTSIPTPDFSTENLRFLTTDQALADEVYFAKNVVFEGLEDKNLTAGNVAYIGYGGSYAGAFNAFLRKLYPDVFWGTISSSGVVEAIWDYWDYYEPIRVYADPGCIVYQQKITNVIDNILIGLKDNATTQELKTAFGLPNVTYDNDFANTVAYGIEEWQGKNWDPAVNDPSFDEYCGNLTSTEVIWPQTEELTSTVQDLLTKGGYGDEVGNLTTATLNMIGWLAWYIIDDCEGSQDSCFSNHNEAFYAEDDINASWRSWPYQYCTEWGFLQTGSGVPADQLPLISRLIDIPYSSLICVGAFNITTPPNVTAINQYGGFNISYPRLAIIDGEHDPWRPSTPHASPFNSTAVNRTSTASEPFILIANAVHHYDENGLFPNQTVNTPPDFLPPIPVRDTQAEELQFVQEWLEEWEGYLLMREKRDETPRYPDEPDHGTEQSIFDILETHASHPNLVTSFIRIPNATFPELLPGGRPCIKVPAVAEPRPQNPIGAYRFETPQPSGLCLRWMKELYPAGTLEVTSR